MKLNGFVGKGSGKLGASVFAISGGEQIVRQYNPQVANPNTNAQVAQRAKLKLLSQLAAALSSAIAFKKQGLVSARNRFVSANIGEANFANEKASVNLIGLELTEGSVALPQIAQPTASQGRLAIALSSAAPENVSIVIYYIFKIVEDNKLAFVTELRVENAGASGTFEADAALDDGQYVVYAYGLIDKSGKATTRFKSYEAQYATTVGTLEVLKSLNATDYTLTATVAAKAQVGA